MKEETVAFPLHCRRPAWCDVHHIVWWSRGGPTTVVNGALLCGFHHRHVHRTNQTATLIVNLLANHFHLIRLKIIGRDIGQHDAVVVQQEDRELILLFGQLRDREIIELEVRPSESGNQMAMR